jgi:molybdenum cofactor sulfurtransferase
MPTTQSNEEAQRLPPWMNSRRSLPPVGSRSSCASNGSVQALLPLLTRRAAPSPGASRAIEHLLHQDVPLLFTFVLASIIAAFSVQWMWHLYSSGPRKRQEDVVVTTTSARAEPLPAATPTRQVNDERIRRKKSFLEKNGDDYGYTSAPCGFIDEWRAAELPGLIPPCDRRPEEDSGSETEVYVDYAGSALPTSSQLRNIQKHLGAAAVLANPHSTGPAAARTRRLVEQAKTRVLDLLHAHPGRYAAFGEHQSSGTPMVEHGSEAYGEGVDRHPGYEVVFTSGTTEALRILSERFPFRKGSMFVYAQNSHTSVVGMRGPVRSRGGSFVCRNLGQLENDVERSDLAEAWFDDMESHEHRKTSPSNHLVAMPLECNFGGNRMGNARSFLSKLRQRSNDSDRYFSLLDIAKAASTSEINLNSLDPDFAVLSFYKLFGEPTGLGCLLVKRSSINILCSGVDYDSLSYFGGGAVDAVLSSTDFFAPRSEPTPLARLHSGTTHFRGIAALHAGFDELERVGGMGFIQRHTRSLAVELVRRLTMLTHEDSGRPVVQLYGGWKQWEFESSESPHSDPGPTVAFNILRGDGTYVGYSEVSKLAALHRPPIQFRTGCFCNPGACQLELGFTDEELLYNFQQAGHVCGDEVCLVKGRPTGAIRVSFGKDSTWEDLDAVVCFLQRVFARPKAEFVTETVRWDAKPRNVVLSELYLFPIKSCAAQRVKRWTITQDGKLSYDREFALVDSSGSAMRLQMYPKMAFIVASIDDHGETMIVSAPGQDDIVIRLDCSRIRSDYLNKGSVKVCGNQCHGSLWGDHHVSQWFSNYLGVRCFLARFNSDSYDLPPDVSVPGTHQRSRGVAFANEQPLLLLSEKAVDTLNQLLVSRNQRLVTPRHFRPNMVVKIEGDRASTKANLEDGWTNLEFEEKDVKLEVVGPCPRCSMVDVDPTSGMKGRTLRALAEYRRCNGQIIFGIFLRASRRANAPCSDGFQWIEEGDVISCS